MTTIKKREWFVKPVEIAVARRIIEDSHYAKSATKTGVAIHGLFKVDEPENCLGVAWWLPPTKNAAASVWENHREVLSLTRMAIYPSVPKNAASFLLSRSIKILRLDKRWKCLLTYADTFQSHTGRVYQASNWTYIGLTAPSEVWVDKSGKMMGKKRGAKNLTSAEMRELGFTLAGRYPKHKYIYIIHR